MGGAAMSTIITGEGLRADEQEAFWRHAISDTFVPVSIGEVTEGDIGGLIRLDSIGRLIVASLAGTPQSIRRTKRHIGEADRDCLLVGLVTKGIARILQDDRQAELYSGDCVVYESSRPYEWIFDKEWQFSVFAFPLGSVQLTESERRLMTAHRLDGKVGISGVVSRFLLDLGRHSNQLPTGQSERVLTQASDLVVTLLSGSVERGDEVRGSIQRSLVLRVKDYVEQRLSDPALGPSEIAAAVNISTRYLHKLFEDEHRSVSQYVRELRLERCRRDLLDPRLADRSISSIAFGRGFGDLSGFNRAFKDAYGMSPRDVRSTRTR
jgi:AraC-like DNA-binding protein